MRYAASFGIRQETAAPMIGAEGFRVTSGPYLDAAIAHHREFSAVAAELVYQFTEIVSTALSPVEENVNANKIFLRSCGCTRRRFCSGRPVTSGFVFGGLQSLR